MTPAACPQTRWTQFFLEARSKMLDLAAILDRVGRGSDAGSLDADPRAGAARRRWRCCSTRAAAGPSASSRCSRSITTRAGSGRNPR